MIILKLVRGIVSSDYVNLYYSGWIFKLNSQSGNSGLERPTKFPLAWINSSNHPNINYLQTLKPKKPMLVSRLKVCSLKSLKFKVLGLDPMQKKPLKLVLVVTIASRVVG